MHEDSDFPLSGILHPRAERVRVLQDQAKKPILYRKPGSVVSEQNKGSIGTTGTSTSSRLPALQKRTPFPNTNNETTETIAASGHSRLPTLQKRTPFPITNNETTETVRTSRRGRPPTLQKRTPFPATKITFPSFEDESISLENVKSTSNSPDRAKRNPTAKHDITTEKEKSTVSSSSRSHIAQKLGHQASSSSTAKQKLQDGEKHFRPQSILVDSRERRPYQLNSDQLSTRPRRRAITGSKVTRSAVRTEATSDGDHSEAHKDNTGRHVNIAASTKDSSLEDMQDQVPAQTAYPTNYSANSVYYSYPNPYSVSSNQPPPGYMYLYQAPGVERPTIEMGKSPSNSHQQWPHAYPAFKFKSTSRASGSNIGHNDFRKVDDPRLAELKELFLANRPDQDQESRFQAMLKDQEEKYVKLLKEKELEAEKKATEKKEQTTKQETNLENIRATAWQQGRMAGIEETRHLTTPESTGRIPTIVEHPKGFPLNDHETLAPVIMRDELGRNLLFPYSKCRTWFVSMHYLSSPSCITRLKNEKSLSWLRFTMTVPDTNFLFTGFAKLDTTGVSSL